MSVKTKSNRVKSKALAPPVVSAVKSDGGPAFPKAAARLHGGGIDFPNSGMSLRDYFAAAALTGILASNAQCKCDSQTCAEAAYEHADAMLAARTTTKGGE